MKIDQIIRTKRKTYALIVEPDGRLIVRAPLQAPDSDIKKLVERKASWIKAKQKQVRTASSRRGRIEFVNGEGFLYLGRFYKLALVDGAESLLVLKDQFYLSIYALPKADSTFDNWYKKQALRLISERVEWYAEKNGFKYQQVKITSAKKRWGSCGSKGGLNFSWRLVMAPLRVIDYVVIHELVHLEVKNHSNAFWDKVKTLMPDYKKQIAWLKKNGQMLEL